MCTAIDPNRFDRDIHYWREEHFKYDLHYWSREDDKSEHKVCYSCHFDLPLLHFQPRRSGELMKGCKWCNLMQSDYRNKNRCKHGKTQAISTCRECEKDKEIDRISFVDNHDNLAYDDWTTSDWDRYYNPFD
jgi:hypothetical protein